MKKILTVILLIIVSLTLSGCLPKGYQSDTTVGREQAEEILRCFNEENIEGLKKLFCQYTKEAVNIDAEICEAFDFYKGKSVSFKFNYNGGIAGSWRDGKAVDEHIEPEIQDISTELGNTYRIYFHEYLTYEKDKKCVGITHMIIFDENTDETIQIGEYVY